MLNILKQDIIRLPRLFRFLQRPLAQLISLLRAPKSKEGYAAIGGGSPLRRITDEQVSHFSFHHLAWNTVSLSAGKWMIGWWLELLLNIYWNLMTWKDCLFLILLFICMWMQWNSGINFSGNVVFQAHALQMVLQAKKMHANVYVGMRYWHPFTEEAIHQVCHSRISC